jgi:hypothetical protein
MLHPCSISLLGKQRNGAPRLWCVIHRARAADAGEFAVKPHRKHLCLACGRDFYDIGPSIGNPIALLSQRYGKKRKVVTPNRPLRVTHADCPGGLQVWGTHAAILWTGPKPEESGIHVHGFKTGEAIPVVDETFDHVEIEGQILDPAQVRLLMAQLAVPALAKRLVSAECPKCGRRSSTSGSMEQSRAVSGVASNVAKSLLQRVGGRS